MFYIRRQFMFNILDLYVVVFDYIFTYYYTRETCTGYTLHDERIVYFPLQSKRKRNAICIYVFCVRRFINFVLDLIYCVCHGHRAKRSHSHAPYTHIEMDLHFDRVMAVRFDAMYCD